MLTFQLNHGNGWFTMNQVTDQVAEGIRAHQVARGRKEGEVWRVVDLTKPETPAKPATRARAPRVRKTAAKPATAVVTGEDGK